MASRRPLVRASGGNRQLPSGDTLDASVTGNAATATKLATARTLSWTGDVTGSTTYDGSGNSSAAVTLAASGVTAGTYGNVTVNAKGLVTGANTAPVNASMKIGLATNIGPGLNYPLQISATGDSGIGLARFSNDTLPAYLTFGKSRGSSLGTVVQSGDYLGNAIFFGDTGSAWAACAAYYAVVDGTPSSGSIPTSFAFGTTTAGNTTTTEKMRLNSAGALLIGTTVQKNSDKLVVSGAMSCTLPAFIGTYTLSTLPSASSYSGYLIQVSNASRGWALCRSNGTSWIDLYTQAAVA